jgi:hypothetical protein
MSASEIAAALAALRRRSLVEAHPGATADIDRGIAISAGTDPALLSATGADVMPRPPIWGVGQ